MAFEACLLTWWGNRNDFITERGGEPEKIRESQRKRHAPVEIVDEIIKDFEDHRQSNSEPLIYTNLKRQDKGLTIIF